MDAVAHLDHQVAQAGLHVVEGGREPPHFVLAGGGQLLGQVAVRDGARAAGGGSERHGDARRHHERHDQAQHVRHQQDAQHRGLRRDVGGFRALDLAVRDTAFLRGEPVEVRRQAVELLAIVAAHRLQAELARQLHGLVVALEVGLPARADTVDRRARLGGVRAGRQARQLGAGRGDGLGDVGLRGLAVGVLVGQHRLVLRDAQVVHGGLQQCGLAQARHRVGRERVRALVDAGQVEQGDAAAEVGHQHDRHEGRQHLVSNAQALDPLHGCLR